MKTIVKSSMVSIGLMVGMVSGLSAEVSVPNTFTAGESASAAEVNENFTALKDGVNANMQKLSGVSTISLDKSSVLTGSYTDQISITITAPSDGYVFVTANGVISTKTSVAVSDYFTSTNVGVTNASATSPENENKIRFYYRGKDYHSYSMPYSVQGVFPVSSGENTFYLVAKGSQLDTKLFYNRLTATFHASEL